MIRRASITEADLAIIEAARVSLAHLAMIRLLEQRALLAARKALQTAGRP